MAYRVIWSTKAVEDVEAIATYISRDSPSYAAAVVRKILDATHQLTAYPFEGKTVAEFVDSTIRENYAYNYRVIYHVDTQASLVTVAAIVHSKALLEISEAISV